MCSGLNNVIDGGDKLFTPPVHAGKRYFFLTCFFSSTLISCQDVSLCTSISKYLELLCMPQSRLSAHFLLCLLTIDH